MSQHRQHQLHSYVGKEVRRQQYEEYDNLSGDAKLQLDVFLSSWRNEIHRNNNNSLGLNDDCFHKIFSFLSVNDLCEVSQTCREFRRLARCYVEVHRKRFYLDRNDFDGTLRSIDAERFIRIFGQCLTKLTLKNNEFQWGYRFLLVIDRYCTKLQELELFDFVFSEFIRGHGPLNQLNDNLQRLAIVNCKDPKLTLLTVNVKSILSQFVSLKHLELNGVRWIVGEGTHVLERHQQLESLSLQNVRLPRIDMFSAFVNECRQLKIVKLSGCFFPSTRTMSIANFTITLPNLEIFWLRSLYIKHVNETRVLHLSNIFGPMCALKELQIDLRIFQKTNLNSLFARLAAQNIIECLCILKINAFPRELVDHLCALTTLKTLIFECGKGFNDEIIKELAIGLPNLTYVGLYLCDVNFTQIATIMEYSRRVHTITLITPVGDNPTDNHLTKNIFSSMVNARQRNIYNNKTLSLLLNGKITSMARLNDNGIDDFLLKWAHVIKVGAI